MTMSKFNKTIVIVASLIFGYVCYGNYRYSQQAKHWPSVTGTVTASAVVREGGRLGGLRPDIHYRFTLNGQVYQGDRLTFGGDHSYYLSDPAPFVAQYPVGKEVDIYYDPKDPNNSLLFPQLNSPLFNLGLALIAWVAAGALTVSLWKSRHNTA